MATRKTPDPFESVRQAFEGLGTSEKAAFVLEATFETIAQGLAETGRRAATVLDDLDVDSWFRMDCDPEDVGAPPAPPPVATPPTPKAKPAPKRKPTSKSKPSSKTAGKPASKKTPPLRPPADDA